MRTPYDLHPQSVTRRQFVERVTGLATAFATACVSTRGQVGGRPNIILLMGDDHGWDETGYNGHPHLKTPVLDEMAASGLRLDRFYAAAPVCSPTRGSILTGRHPNRYGAFTPNWSMRPEEITIAHILAKAGYACGHFGKWHVGAVKAESPVSPRAMGFEEYLSHDNFFEVDPTLSRNGARPEKIAGESSEIVIDETIRFVDKAKRAERPYFVVAWFGSPHEPYIGLKHDLALYDDLPKSYNDKVFEMTDLTTGEPARRSLRDVLRERYAEITAMDRAIGKLRRHLDREGLRRSTLLWYCGDNGTPGDGAVTIPFRGQKGQVYEGGVRVPGIIEWPARIPSPRVSDINAVTSDMLPTLCALAGEQPPNRPLDGISLLPVIAGDMKERPNPIGFWNFAVANVDKSRPYIDPALQEGTTPLLKAMDGKLTRSFTNFHHPSIRETDYRGPRTLLDNRFKLVIHDRQGGEALRELFDVRSDPAEKRNLIEEHPQIADRLERKLREWQHSVLVSLTGADYRP
jgi:arylsulfatase A-like enzyme